MRKPVVLITGAGGEIGHGLVTRLAAAGSPIITLDVSPLDASLAPLVRREFTGSITDVNLLDRMLAEFEVERVFHLAALLSTRSEFTPVTAHHVNVEGTLNLLEFAQHEGESHGRPVHLHLSVVDRGLRPAEPRGEDAAPARSREDQFALPTTMYGCNKLYCEQLGHYYAQHYKQLSADAIGRVDFRCVRFPGLISAMTLPSGGTSDYAPEMIHAAAKGEPYDCFVRPDTQIPFMAMPDGVDALMSAGGGAARAADAERLQPDRVQSVGRRDPRRRRRRVSGRGDRVRRGRQAPGHRRFVAGGGGRLGRARATGDSTPKYDFDRAFREYLIPTIRERYQPCSVVDAPSHSRRPAHRHNAAAATVNRMKKGSVARRGPSAMTRSRCARVIKPKIAPVVMT